MKKCDKLGIYIPMDNNDNEKRSVILSYILFYFLFFSFLRKNINSIFVYFSVWYSILVSLYQQRLNVKLMDVDLNILSSCWKIQGSKYHYSIFFMHHSWSFSYRSMLCTFSGLNYTYVIHLGYIIYVLSNKEKKMAKQLFLFGKFL